ncbi:MAG TPA: hypothetical protein VH560_19200, partial [Polyangia bacterium]|nr:hypothetical protein [Polyangia bacterium]
MLSPRREARAGLAAGGTVGVLTLIAATTVGIGLTLGGRIIHTPTFVAVWLVVGVALSLLAARRARGRARRYVIGVDIDDDAFAPVPQILVRRDGARYELALAPGMSGIVEGGRAPLHIEALVREGRARLQLDAGTRAEITMTATTFVVRGRADVDVGAP